MPRRGPHGGYAVASLREVVEGRASRDRRSIRTERADLDDRRGWLRDGHTIAPFSLRLVQRDVHATEPFIVARCEVGRTDYVGADTDRHPLERQVRRMDQAKILDGLADPFACAQDTARHVHKENEKLLPP